MPGVVRVLTSEDVPKRVHTLLILLDIGPDDEPPLAFDKVRYRGEPVAAVIAETESAAAAAAAKVRVDYEPLPAVFDVEESLAPGAPLVNEYHGRNWYDYDGHDFQKIRFGDVERAFGEADQRRRGALPDDADRARADRDRRVHRGARHRGTLRLLHQHPGAVLQPGDRGADTQGAVEPAALRGRHRRRRLRRQGGLRPRAARPSSVRCSPSARYEAPTPARRRCRCRARARAERFYIKDGVMDDGRIVARYARIYCDAGAYSRLTPYGAIKAARHMPGPYWIPNVWVDARCVYTNRTPSSAMRGFGVTGADFALEVQMDKLARLVGMDPMEFRILNAYRDGDMKAHRRLTKNAALIECVQAAAQLTDWPIAEGFRAMSSTRDGGGERAKITPTPGLGAGSGAPRPPAPLAGARDCGRRPTRGCGRSGPRSDAGLDGPHPHGGTGPDVEPAGNAAALSEVAALIDNARA